MTTETTLLAEEAPAATDRTRRDRQRLTVVTLVSGVLTVLFAGLLPLAPVTVNDPTVQWPLDASAPRSTMLPLGAYRPLGLDARFSCATARAAESSGGVVFSTIDPGVPAVGERGLVVRAEAGRVVVRGPGVTVLDEPVPAGDCAYQVRGDQAGLAVLRNGAEVARGPAGVLPDVHVLTTSITSLASAGLTVRIRVDDQFNTSPAPLKIVLMVLLSLAAIITVVCLVLLDRRIERSPATRSRWRLRLVDLAVPAVMVLWMFLAPMSDDDGYYSAMARNVPFEGYVGNYYQLHNQGFTPFSWFYYFLAKWQVFGSAPVVLRIPALLFGLVTWAAARWFVAEAKVVPPAWRERSPWVERASRAVLGAAFLVWWLPLDMGVRPEGVVTMCGVLTLLAVTIAVERQRLVALGAAVGVAGVGFFAHPTGFTVLAPLLAGWVFAWRLLRRDGADWRTVLARVLAVVSPAALAAFAAFADGSLRDFFHAQAIFLRLAGQESWYTEFVRYMFLLNPSDPMANYAKRAPVLVCIAALVWFVVLVTAARARRIPVPARLSLAGWSTLLAFLLLWFTPSKWTHHFGSLAGIGSVFLALMLLGSVPLVRELTRDRRLPVPVVLGAVASVVAMLALAAHGANKWPYSWLLGMPHADVAPFVSVVRLDKPLLWLAAIGAVSAAVFWWARRRAPGWRSYAPVVAVPVVVVLFFAANITYLVGGFAVATVRTLDTWSPWAASVQDPLAARCVAADAIDVLDVRNARALDMLPGQPATDESGFVSGRGWFAPAPPPAGGVSARIWGSLIPRPGQDAPERNTGGLRTPWFALGGSLPAGGALATVVSGRLAGGNTLTAEYANTAGEVVSRREITDRSDSVLWRNLVLAESGQLPAGASAVRLVATDGTVDRGGWLAVSAPSVQRPVALREYLPGDAAVAVAWQFAFLFPCQRQPRLQDGIIEPISYAVQWGDTPLSGLGDATWQPGRGGLFGDVIFTQSVTSLTARLRDFPGQYPLQVYQTAAPYPAQQYTLTRQHQTLLGWEAIR